MRRRIEKKRLTRRKGCPNECTGRGVCVEGRCDCDDYYVGESCAYCLIFFFTSFLLK